MMDLTTLFTPWNLAGAACGLIVGVALVLSTVLHRRQIGAVVVTLSKRLFSPVGFFGLVIVVFLVISVLESGEFFDVNITHHAIFGLLGYALALGFDLVSVVCMQARLNATRMRDESGARLNLLGVCLCAAVSAFANAAGSLQGYNPANLDHTPMWMSLSAPWLGLVFPALIVVLSMTADHILDHAPSRDINVEQFRARERKRVELLQVRLETERELLTLESELTLLRQRREQASGKVQREWFFWHWLRPVAPAPVSCDATPQSSDQAVQTQHNALKTLLEEVQTTVRALEAQARIWGADRQRAWPLPRTQDHAEQAQVCTLGTNSLDQGTGAHPEALEKQDAPEEPASPMRASKSPARHGDYQGTPRRIFHSVEEQESAATVLLAAYHRLGVATSDNRMAREVGYSRKTVARWKKRFLEQGVLAIPPDYKEQPLEPQDEPEQAG